MQQLRQQLKYLQAELCFQGGVPADEVRVFIITETCMLNWHEFI